MQCAAKEAKDDISMIGVVLELISTIKKLTILQSSLISENTLKIYCYDAYILKQNKLKNGIPRKKMKLVLIMCQLQRVDCSSKLSLQSYDNKLLKSKIIVINFLSLILLCVVQMNKNPAFMVIIINSLLNTTLTFFN